MIGSFLQVETICPFGKVFHDFGSQPGTSVVRFSIHVYVDGFRIERTSEVQLSPLVNLQGMFQHLGSCLFHRVQRLSGELQLPLEVGMLVHEVQQIVVNDGEISPNGWSHIAVIVHVPV